MEEGRGNEIERVPIPGSTPSGGRQGDGVPRGEAEGEVPRQEPEPLPHLLVAPRPPLGQEGRHQDHAQGGSQD